MDTLTKEEIIEGIEACARMEGIWYNKGTPNNTFSHSVSDIKKTLTKMLDVKICECGGSCGCKS